MSNGSTDYSAPARTGWILLFLTCGLSLIPFFGFASWIIAGPMLIAAFVLAIVVLSRGGTGSGILLLLFSVVIAPVFILCAPFITTALGIGGAAATTAAAAPAIEAATQPPPTRSTAPTNLKRFATVAEAQQEALRLYPALGVAGSPFNREFVARHKKYQQERPEFLRDTGWPVMLAREVATTVNSQ